MATHSSILAWKIPEMREPGGLPSMGSHRVGHDWSDLAAATALDLPAACGLTLVAASWGCSLLQWAGFSLQWLLLWRSTGFRHTGSEVVVHRLSCFTMCGTFPGQESKLCSLHWLADSYTLCHSGSPPFSLWPKKFSILSSLHENSLVEDRELSPHKFRKDGPLPGS